MMKKEKLLEDAIKAINIWRAECAKQGDMPVCISVFAAINHDKQEISCDKYRVFGEQNYVSALLEDVRQIINLKSGKKVPVSKKPTEESVMEDIMKMAKGGDILHVKFPDHGDKKTGKKGMSIIKVIKGKLSH